MPLAVFYPLILPVLQLVTLATTPATALYAIGGLLVSPLVVPVLIIKNIVTLTLLSPLFLLTLPVSVPAGFVLASSFLVIGTLLKAFCLLTLPLTWPLVLACKWYKITACISRVMVTDTILPWLVPIRFTFLAAIIPKLIFG